MASNRKLLSVIKGRTITSIDRDGSVAQVRFKDGSVMTVHLAGESAPKLAAPGAVAKVRQQGTHLSIDLDPGGTLDFDTAEATSSVMLRDKAQALEYAD